MYGGVGAAVSNGGGYPISAYAGFSGLLFCSCHHQNEGLAVASVIILVIDDSSKPHSDAFCRACSGVSRPYQRPYIIVAVLFEALKGGGGGE
jgi:hypothetical protein